MIRALEIPGLQGTQVNAPQVSPSAAAAPAAALGSVAAAIGGVSDTFAGIADRIQKFENAHSESTIRNEWLTGYAKVTLENDKDNDPESRLRRTQDYLQQQKATLDRPNLSPVVRDRLNIYYDDFAGRANIDTADKAARLSMERATQAIANGIEASERAGNLAGVEREVKTGVDEGIFTPEKGAKIIEDSKQTIRRNSLLTEAANDPAGYLDRYGKEKPEGINDLEHLDQLATARRALALETSNASEKILDGIITGNITTPKQIDELTPGLRPAAKESLKNHLAERANKQTRALKQSPAYQASAVAKVQQMLDAWTVDNDGYDEAYVEMARIVRDLPPGAVRDELTRNLEQSRSGQVKVIETAADYHRQSLTDLHAAGAFGTGLKEQPVEKILADGILRDPAKLQRRGFTAEQAAVITSAEVDKKQLQAAGIPKETAEKLAGKVDSEARRVTLFRELSKTRAGFDQSTDYERAALDAIQKGDTGLIQFPDLAAREKSRRAYGLAKTKLEDWLKRNPNATEEQGREALLRITGETAIPGMVDQILEAPPAFDTGMVLPDKPAQ